VKTIFSTQTHISHGQRIQFYINPSNFCCCM